MEGYQAFTPMLLWLKIKLVLERADLLKNTAPVLLKHFLGVGPGLRAGAGPDVKFDLAPVSAELHDTCEEDQVLSLGPPALMAHFVDFKW